MPSRGGLVRFEPVEPAWIGFHPRHALFTLAGVAVGALAARSEAHTSSIGAHRPDRRSDLRGPPLEHVGEGQ